MATIGGLEAVFAHLVEVEAPAIDSLPENTNSADWLRAQDFATARVSPTGNVVELAKAGVPELLTFATAVRATDPRYARGTRLNSFVERVFAEIVAVARSRAGGPIQPAEVAVAPSGRSVSIALSQTVTTGYDLALDTGLPARRSIQEIAPRHQAERFRRAYGRWHRPS